MYRISHRLPSFEKFDLGSQIRRAATSLTNNIAEGYGRYHYLNQLKFLLQARGSLTELIDDLNICLDEKYLPSAEIDPLKQLGWRVHNIINGYGRYLRKRKAGDSLALHEVSTEYHVEDDDNPFADLRF